jgi:hypothetical protein
MTTPGVDEKVTSTLDDETRTKIRQASADAATAAFGAPAKTVEPSGQDKFIQSVKDDPDSFLPPQPSRPPTPAPKPSPIYDNVAAGDYNDDSTGVNKGALMTKKNKKKKSK